jgi:hypothetical protein
MTRSKFFALGCLFFSLNSFAASDVHKIASVEITEVSELTQASSPMVTPPAGDISVGIGFNFGGNAGGLAGDVGGALGEIGDIVNIGQSVWNIIETNKPVGNVSTNTANAIPASIQSWTELQGWQMPQTKTYMIAYKDSAHITMVSFTFKVLYTPGGNVNGVGQFLSGVTIVPADMTVVWGMKFAADVKVLNVTNAGSSATPIAAMQLQIHWTVDSIIDHIEAAQDFYIRGDGQFSEMN